MADRQIILGTTNNEFIESKIEWWYTSDLVDITSTVTAELYYRRTNTGYVTGGYGSFSITIDGDKGSVSGVYKEISTSWVKIMTHTATVNHDDDGTKSLVITASGSINGTTLKSTDCSDTVTLDTIPRVSAPTVSASTVAMNDAVTIYTNRKSNTFTHTLSYSFGGTTGTIATNVGASYAWTVPDLAGKIANSTSGTCTITCKTYSGSTLIGTKTVKVTLTVPNKSTPTASASSVKMNSSVTITTNRNSTAFTHTLTYSFGGVTGTIATGVTASYAWTVPDLASKISGATSGTCTITCKTYNGSALVGTATVSITLTVPDKSTPSASASTVKMGESVNIYTNRKSTAFTHTLTYQIGDASGTIDTGVLGGRTWTPSKELAAYTGNKTSATCTITCKTYNGSALVGTATSAIILTVPDATVPKLSATTVEMGSSITISFPKEADAYTHDVSYAFEGVTGTIATGVSADLPWTVPFSLAAEIPSESEGTVTITCKTRFKNSDTVVGTNTVSFTATVPNNSSTEPKVTMSVECVSDLPDAFDGIYVAGKSKVKVTLNATSAYSEIASYKTTVQSESSNKNPYTSALLTTTGNVTITGKVTDSRGNSTTKTDSITVVPYSRPRIIPGEGQNSIICKRCNSDGTVDAGGAYLLIKIGRKYSTVESGGEQKNFCKLSYRHKTDAADDSGYSDPIELLAEDASSDYVSVVLAGIVPSNTIAYTIQLIAEDDIGESDVVTTTIPTAFITFHAPEGGHGFTLGGYHDPSKIDVFDCIFDAEFQGDVSGRVLGLGALPEIPEGADANDYKNAGAYSVRLNTTAATLVNFPDDKAGTLRVWYSNGGDIRTNYAYIIQEYIPYNNYCTYRRYLYLSGESWEYGTWKVAGGCDAIVSQGETDGWYWRKYANGIAECWRRVSQTVAITIEWGAIFYGNCEEVVFPFDFYSAPIVNATVESSYALWLMSWTGSASSGTSLATKPASLRVARPTAVEEASIIVAYHAIGRWQ